jgi:hypothetical protein
MFNPFVDDGGAATSRQCEQTQQAVEALLEACGVARPSYAGNEECTAKSQAIQECVLGCYQKAPCDAILGHDDKASIALTACGVACQ